MVQGAGCRVYGIVYENGTESTKLRVKGWKFRVWGLQFRLRREGFRVQGLVFSV